MKMYRNYADLSSKIHAPEELKARVLKAAAQTQRQKGLYSRGWSVMQKAVAAAAAVVLAISLPVAGYAAVKGLGLKDYFAQRGMQDLPAVEKLTNAHEDIVAANQTTAVGQEVSADPTGAEPQAVFTCENTYAVYAVQEAVLDSHTIYISALITPKEGYFLVPGEFGLNDPVSMLNLEGVEGGTIEEYARSIGKEAVGVSMHYGIGADITTTAVSSVCMEDGSIYQYESFANPFDGKDITMKCAAIGNRTNIEPENRVEFELKLTDKSTTTEQVYTTVDAKAFEETGVQIVSLTLEETEMGLYATFRFTTSDGKIPHIDLRIADGSGKELMTLPGEVGTGILDNGDGTYSCTKNYQKPSSLEGLQITMWDIVGDILYGPYSFES